MTKAVNGRCQALKAYRLSARATSWSGLNPTVTLFTGFEHTACRLQATW